MILAICPSWHRLSSYKPRTVYLHTYFNNVEMCTQIFIAISDIRNYCCWWWWQWWWWRRRRRQWQRRSINTWISPAFLGFYHDTKLTLTQPTYFWFYTFIDIFHCGNIAQILMKCAERGLNWKWCVENSSDSHDRTHSVFLTYTL